MIMLNDGMEEFLRDRIKKKFYIIESVICLFLYRAVEQFINCLYLFQKQTRSTEMVNGRGVYFSPCFNGTAF